MSPSNKKHLNRSSTSPTPKKNPSLKKKIVPSPPPSSPIITATAPPALYTTRSIYINNNYYEVELPEEFDIYEGLRRWYPSLYLAVLEEEYDNRVDIVAEEDTFTEEEMEAMWAHYDYLEYIYD